MTASQMRAAELACDIPLIELMERAGRALAQAALRFGGGAPVLVLCGPGNNGGDGYVAARTLAERGIDVRVAALGLPATDLATRARDLWAGQVERLDAVESAPVIVDALFGVGMSRPLASDISVAVARLARASKIVIAADVPSGVGSDDGVDFGASNAAITVAFGAAKLAHLLQPAASLCGRVLIADLGMTAQSSVNVLARPRLPRPTARDHKYTRGMVAVVAGDMPGAATLAVTAAAHLAAYTLLCGAGDAPNAVVHRPFEMSLADPKLGAMLVGPGLSASPDNQHIVHALLKSNVPAVLDAGALALVEPSELRRASHSVITPHEGELVRLFGKLGGSKIERAKAAAAHSGATLIYKGSDTVIASPDGRVTLSPPVSPWLATAGTGDVLAGMTVALLGQGLDPHEAACAAVWLHGEAARLAGVGFVADDLCKYIPAALSAAIR